MQRAFHALCLCAVTHGADLTASWYGYEIQRGSLMANGQPFNPAALTCASWSYPLGTRLRVARGTNAVVVTVTDRGPAKRLLRTRQIDLSRAAFARLAPLRDGLTRVHVTTLNEPIPNRTRPKHRL